MGSSEKLIKSHTKKTHRKKDFQNVIQNTHFILELLNIASAKKYLAMLQELKKKCVQDKKLKWPMLFQRFTDDGFGVMNGRHKLHSSGIFDFKIFQKEINRHMFYTL